jgi:hypothetical protein
MPERPLEDFTGSLRILPVGSDDDAASAFAAYRTSVDEGELAREFDDFEADEPDTQDGAPVEQPAPAPAADQGKAPAKPDDGDGAGLGSTAMRFLNDIGGGAVEAPGQIAGGAIDAVNEVMQTIDDLGNAFGDLTGFNPQLQLFDREGNLSLDLLDTEEADAAREAGDIGPLELPTTGGPDTTTGQFIRSTTQFLAAFLPATAALKTAAGAGKVGAAVNVPFAREMIAGAFADAVAFDPHEDRLATYLNTIPVLQDVVPDYLADNDPANESAWVGRLKNTIEGAGLGLATEGLIRAFKYYKAQRRAKVAAKAAAEPDANALAAAGRDAIRDAAAEDFVNPVTDSDLLGLGRETDDLIVAGGVDENAAAAFGRLAAADQRLQQIGLSKELIKTVDDVVQRFTGGDGTREALDDVIDQVRSGVKLDLPKRPLSKIVRDLGGVKTGSPLAKELKNVGVTPRTAPGLFRNANDARVALDNIEKGAYDIFGDAMVDVGDDIGSQYVPEQAFIGGLAAEINGEPLRSAKQQQMIEGILQPVEELTETLDRAGIDVNTMSNAQVKQRLDDIAEEIAAFERAGEGPDAVAGSVTVGGHELPLNPDGSVTLFHGTSRASADQIAADGVVRPGPEREVFLTTTPDDIGFGDTVVEVRVDPQTLRLDDVFPDGRADFVVAGEVPVNAGDTRGAIIPAGEPAALPGLPQGKVFVNHARIKTADDVRALIQVMADAEVDAIDAKTGGKVVTNKQTVKASKKEFQSVADLIGRDPGPMTGAQAVAARKILAASGEQLLDLARKAQSDKASPADLFAFRRAMSVHAAIQNEVLAARRETARALQSWAIPAGSDTLRAQAISDLLEQSGGAGSIHQLARAIGGLADNPTGLNVAVKQAVKFRKRDAFYQAWINGLLSSPKTHAVNILSNSITALWSVPENLLAAGISHTFDDGAIHAGEAGARAFGAAKGVRDAVVLIARGSGAEGSSVDDLFQAFGKVEGVHGNAISGETFGREAGSAIGAGIDYLGRALNLPSTLLQAEDNFFKSVGYRMELQGQAYRAAMAEGLEGREFAARVYDLVTNPPDHIKAEALDAAHYQTFTNPLGPLGRKFQTALRSNMASRFVAPFIRTPTNIVKYAFERTPLAFMSARIRADLRAGGARASQAKARVALGSMLMLTVADMAADGGVTGQGPADGKLRKIWLNSHKPYSIKVGDTWVQYSRLDPIGMLIGMSADIADIVNHVDEEDSERLVAAGAIAFAQNLASKTYMRGVVDFIGAIDPNNPQKDLGKWAVGFSSSLMPYSSLIRNIARADDPVLREARTAAADDFIKQNLSGTSEPVAEFLMQLVNAQRKNIPGLSDELPLRRNLWGDEIDLSSKMGWAFDLVSPVSLGDASKANVVDRAILDNGVKLSSAPRRIQQVSLTGEEYSRFVEMAGKPALEDLKQIVKEQWFKELSNGPDGMKAQIIKERVRKHRSIAARRMLLEFPDLQQRIIDAKVKRQKLLLEGNTNG